MSDFFQPGQHPDAEQISAFAENALPSHERDFVLAHLADCSHCRHVVALSQAGAEEEALVAEPRKARKPWFAGWKLAWPVLGTALAAALVLAVHLHISSHQATTLKTANLSVQEKAGSEIAANTMPSPASVSAPAPAQASALRPRQTPAANPAQPQPVVPASPPLAEPRVSAGIAGMAAAWSPNATINAQAQDLPVNDRNATALAYVAPGAVSSQGSGSVHGRLAQPAPSFTAEAGPVVLDAPAKVPAPIALAKAAPAPPSNALSASNAVMVDGAADRIERANAVSLSALTPASAAISDRARALPSRNAIASSIARDGRMLALDTAGALFLSSDGGVHWKTISSPWHGRAVSVGLASFQKATGEPGGSKTSDQRDAPADRLRVAASALSGRITDATGAVISGAVVTATTAGFARSVKTDAAGFYGFGTMSPGNYQLRVTSPGFAAHDSTIRITGAETREVDFTLQMGASSESVTVEANSAMDDLELQSQAHKKKSPSIALAPFTITTDSGEHWTSADGLTWSHK